MPGSMNKPSTEKAKWVHFKLYTQPELAEALSNYLTEMGAQGVFEEFLQTGVSDVPEPEPQDERVLNAYFPSGTEDEKHLSDLQSYIDSLAELFPELEKPTFSTEVIHDPDWGEAWKKYFKPLRVSRNLVIKPTWERFAPTGPGHRHRDRPRHGLRHRPARLHADVPRRDRGDPPQGPDLREMACPGRRDGNGHPRHRLREAGRRAGPLRRHRPEGDGDRPGERA